MKKLSLSCLFLLLTLSIYSQNIEVDIFENLEYQEHNYKAYLEKDIFDNLIFTDTNKNKLTYKKRYLEENYKGLHGNIYAKKDFFRFLIQRYKIEKSYEATFSIDILDKEIIEDNRNNRLEREIDIFGNPKHQGHIGGIKTKLRKDLLGAWIYKMGNQEASLKKDIFDKWLYTDSHDNKFEFSSRTWQNLLRRHKSEENIFIFLVNEFLLD